MAVRTLFSRARTCSPCILFFDEVCVSLFMINLFLLCCCYCYCNCYIIGTKFWKGKILIKKKKSFDGKNGMTGNVGTFYSFQNYRVLLSSYFCCSWFGISLGHMWESWCNWTINEAAFKFCRIWLLLIFKSSRAYQENLSINWLKYFFFLNLFFWRGREGGWWVHVSHVTWTHLNANFHDIVEYVWMLPTWLLPDTCILKVPDKTNGERNILVQ